MMRRYFTLMGLGALIACATMLLTPKAQADSDTYLYRMNTEYGYVYDADATLVTGAQICARLNYENGADTAAWLYVYSPYINIPTPAAAALWLTIAVEELCPWHDHRLKYAV